MSPTPSDFRDPEISAGQTPRRATLRPDGDFAAEAYRPPRFDSAVPDEDESDARTPPPRLSPGWTILLGTAPVLLSFAFAVATRHVPALAPFALAWMYAAVESAAFTARTVFSGPGPLVVRIPIALAAALMVPLAVGWFPWITGESTIVVAGGAPERAATAAAIFLASAFAAWPVAAIARALGSADVARDRMRRPASSADWIAVAAAWALTLLALAPWLFGAFDAAEYEALLALAPDAAAAAPFVAILLAFVYAISHVWRMLARGLDRIVSWRTGVAAAAATAMIVIFCIAVLTTPEGTSGAPGLWYALVVGMFASPIAREFFIRLAGYRAVNLYLEAWRKRRKITRASTNA